MRTQEEEKKLSKLLTIFLIIIYTLAGLLFWTQSKSQNYIGYPKCEILNIIEKDNYISIGDNIEESYYLSCTNELLGIPYVYFFNDDYICQSYIILYHKDSLDDLIQYLNYYYDEAFPKYNTWKDPTGYYYKVIKADNYALLRVEPINY